MCPPVFPYFEDDRMTSKDSKEVVQKPEKNVVHNAASLCAVSRKCGGCRYIGMDYQKQLKVKQKEMEGLLGGFCKVEPILGMDDPMYYRNKVHHVFGRDKKGNQIKSEVSII